MTKTQKLIEEINKYNTYLRDLVEVSTWLQVDINTEEQISELGDLMQQTLQNWQWAGIWKPAAEAEGGKKGGK